MCAFNEQECLSIEGHCLLWDRNPNTYSSILESPRPWDDLKLEDYVSTIAWSQQKNLVSNKQNSFNQSDLDLDMVKMYHHAKNEVSVYVLRHSKVTAQTHTHTHSAWSWLVCGILSVHTKVAQSQSQHNARHKGTHFIVVLFSYPTRITQHGFC